MWDNHTIWFDISMVMTIFALGNIIFGHFEEHKPKWQRVLKVVVVLAVVLTLAANVGRIWAFGFVALLLLGAAYIHLVWLPKHGINGWTGEPKERYYELIKARK